MKSLQEQLKEIKKELTYSNNKWVDSHAHYNTKQFIKDKDNLLTSLTDEVALIINCGTNDKSNKETIDLCNHYNFIKGTIGYFPCDTLDLENNPKLLEKLEKQCKNDSIIGIGEIGLDYHWNSVGYKDKTIKGPEAIKIQKKWFIEQIKLANKLHLPIIVHSRDAEKDTLDILKQYKPEYGCIIHCYAYGIESAKEYVKLGFYFGVGGTSTYKGNVELCEALKYIPIEQIVLETDCPYLTPEPKRRDRNDSSYIKYVIKKLSEIKNISENEIIKITNSNIEKVYNIKLF